ncbi:hypothetical protein HMPREF2936_09800 [Neisseria sp. HMSC064F04]|nr:hypothetical protein HMPREF2936_09800 [Neisseria sp. HMSC064F04]
MQTYPFIFKQIISNQAAWAERNRFERGQSRRRSSEKAVSMKWEREGKFFRRPFVRLYQRESAKIARFPLQPDSSNT